MTDWTVSPPGPTPTTSAPPSPDTPPLYWQGTTPGGAPGVTTDPHDPGLTNLQPVYPTKPGEKPTFGGGGKGDTTTWTVMPPSAPTRPPQAAPAPSAALPGMPPPPAPVPAPDASQGVGGALVPMLPQGAPQPQRPQGVGDALTPPAPSFQTTPQQPAGPPPPPIQYSVLGHNIPTSITHPLDVFGTGVGEGLLGLGAMPADLVNLGMTKLGMPLYSPWGATNLVHRTLDPTGAMQPTTAGEQWLANLGGAVGGGLPFLPLGMAGATGRMIAEALAREGASAVGSSTAQTLAQQYNPDSAAAQFAASLLGGMGGRGIYNVTKGMGAAAEAGTTAGQQALAGQRIAAASTSPETLATRLRTTPSPGLPGAPQTTAMAANLDPRLAQVEHAVYSTPEGGARLRAVEAQRNQAIADALTNMRSGRVSTAASRGADIRAGAQAQERAMLGDVTRLYTAARAAPGTTSLRPVLSDIARITRDRFGAGSAGAPAAFRRIAGEIAARADRAPVNATYLMNMSRQLGDEAREAFRAGRNTEGAAYRQLQQAVDRLSPNAAYDAARTYRAQVGRLTGRDATGSHAMGDVLGTDKFGAPRVADDRVTSRILSAGPGGVRQMLDAADEAIQAARRSGGDVAGMQIARAQLRNHLREAFLDEAERQRTAKPTPAMTAGGVSTVTPTFSQAKWSNFWRQNQGTARLLFDPHHLDNLERIGRQLDETAAVERAGAAKGSDTAQILQAAGKGDSPSLAHVLGAMTQGRSSPGSLSARMALFAINKLPVAIVAHHAGAVAGMVTHMLGADHITDLLFRRGDEAINALVQNAASDPQLARMLVQRATERGLLDVLNRSRQTGGAFWRFVELARRPMIAGSAATAGAARPPLP